jgi:hypothetical protein
MQDNAYQTNILLLHKVELKEHHNIAEIVLKLAQSDSDVTEP